MSVRTRLTLWNVCVLALMLIGLGFALRITLQVSLMQSIDRALIDSVNHEEFMAENGPPGGIGPMRPPMFGQGLLSPHGRSNQLPPHPPGKADQGGPFGKYHPQSWGFNGQPFFPWGEPRPYNRFLFTESLMGGRNYATQQAGGIPVRMISIPLRRDHRIIGVVQAGYPLTEEMAELRRLTDVLLLLAGPALIIAGLGGAYLTSRALRPVRQITQAAGELQAQDLSKRLPVAGRDELAALAMTFNGMLARLDDAFKQRAAAYTRLEEVNDRLERAYEQEQRFTADASHELKTPLTVIAGTVSLALSGKRTPEQYRNSLDTIGKSTAMMTRVIQDLLLLAHSDAGLLAGNCRPVALAEVVALACDACTAAVAEPPRIVLEIAPDALVRAEPDHLVRLFVNLLDNAIRHTPVEGSIRVSAAANADQIVIDIEDTGCGVAPEHLSHLTERFYRVDAARSRSHGGTGLGLAICRSIVESYGGVILIESELGRGTTVQVRLPCSEATMEGDFVPNLETVEAEEGLAIR